MRGFVIFILRLSWLYNIIIPTLAQKVSFLDPKTGMPSVVLACQLKFFSLIFWNFNWYANCRVSRLFFIFWGFRVQNILFSQSWGYSNFVTRERIGNILVPKLSPKGEVKVPKSLQFDPEWRILLIPISAKKKSSVSGPESWFQHLAYQFSGPESVLFEQWWG